jgi:AcrR family transcriptional regulator
MNKTAAKPIKKRDRQATTRKLFEAALAVFSERGFDGATTKLVAQQAGVTESLIMKYFGNKRGLLLALFEDFACKHAEGEKDPYPEGKDLEAEFASFLTEQIDKSQCTKEFTRVIMGSASVDELMRQELNKKVSLDWHPVLKARLKGYRDRGEIPRSAQIDDLICWRCRKKKSERAS